MGASSAPGPQEKRLAAYMEGLAKAAGHADREQPLKAYCAGLLLPGERKSVEPMAARLAPDNVRRTHQSLHHLVAHAPWSDEALLEKVRHSVLPRMTRKTPLVAWIVDDTSFVKKGKHSVGVARQYCGAVGKQENCQVAVSLSVATAEASLPIAWRLYLPESWAKDSARREAAGVPDEIGFQTKPRIAREQIRQAVEQGVPAAPVLADSAYGNDTQFREGLTELGRLYAVGVHETTTVWRPGETPQPKPRHAGRGRPPTRLERDGEQRPVSVKELALSLPPQAWKRVTWREGTRGKLRSHFAAVRVRPAHRDERRSTPHPEEWLLMEWPKGEAEPTHYWLSTLPADTRLTALVKLAKHRYRGPHRSPAGCATSSGSRRRPAPGMAAHLDCEMPPVGIEPEPFGFGSGQIGTSRRYRTSDAGLRTLVALVLLRDKVIKPLLASCCQRRRGRKPNHATRLDAHYERLQDGMRELFQEIGLAA